MSLSVKICGITDVMALEAAAASGASHVGFVFFDKSPRYLDYKSADVLVTAAPSSLTRVGVVVDATDDGLVQLLEHVPELDMIQCHGAETAERLAQIKELISMPLIKAIPVRTAQDVAQAKLYQDSADIILFDAKTDHVLPGGVGQSFDWSFLEDISLDIPWWVAGGIRVGNVADVLKIPGISGIDVSSGVEARPGHKDIQKITQLLDLIRHQHEE